MSGGIKCSAWQGLGHMSTLELMVESQLNHLEGVVVRKAKVLFSVTVTHTFLH